MSEMSTGLKTHFTLSLLWSNKNSDNHNLHIKCRFYLFTHYEKSYGSLEVSISDFITRNSEFISIINYEFIFYNSQFISCNLYC